MTTIDNEQISFISLKWGTLKGYYLKSKEENDLLTKYIKLGYSLSCAAQNDTNEQKEILCKLIDLCNNPKGIHLEWDNIFVSKEEAKKYIMEYGKRG